MKHNNLLIDKLFPITTSVNADDTLTIGNLNIHELARKFGTPSRSSSRLENGDSAM